MHHSLFCIFSCFDDGEDPINFRDHFLCHGAISFFRGMQSVMQILRFAIRFEKTGSHIQEEYFFAIMEFANNFIQLFVKVTRINAYGVDADRAGARKTVLH